jgi:hypothetical protein
MSIAERVALVDQMSLDVERIALAGIRQQQPGIGDVDARHELARRRYGRAVADRAFGRGQP